MDNLNVCNTDPVKKHGISAIKILNSFYVVCFSAMTARPRPIGYIDDRSHIYHHIDEGLRLTAPGCLNFIDHATELVHQIHYRCFARLYRFTFIFYKPWLPP